MRQGKTAAIRLFAPPILWMLVIFIISGDLGSMNNTSSFLVPLIRAFFSEISSDALDQIQFAIRKSGHLLEYAILALLWCIALTKGSAIVRYPAMVALLCAVAYAGLDELHQAFVKSRTGSIVDVGIDTFGAFLGLGLWKGLQVFRDSSNHD